MRKALVTLFGAGLLGAILIPSCVLKSSDDGDGSDKGGAASGGNGPSLDGTGGKSSANGGASDGGTTSDDTTTVTLADACPGLKITNGNGETCGSTTMAASYTDIHMLIVLDKSGSMDTTPTGFDQTKWSATKTALSAALEGSTEQVRYGLLMYPYSTGTVAIPSDCGTRCCELPTSSADAVNVPVAEAKTSVPEITDKLDETKPSGGTPTAAALKAAYDYYVTGSGGILEGDKYVLLATDGAPNCNAEHEACEAATCTANIDAASGSSCGGTIANCCEAAYASAGAGPSACVDDMAVLGQIEELAKAGIKTFVVGIPGTENYKSYLTKFAEAGGVPDPQNQALAYYEVTADAGVDGLTKTFKGITETLVRDCDIKLGKAPLDPKMLNVAVECTTLPQSAGEVINWEYNGDADDPTITIKGTTCDTIEAQGVTRVDVIEGCTTIVLT